MCTIEELIAVCPGIEVISESDFAKEILDELLEEYDVDFVSIQTCPWLMSDSDRMKWNDYLQKYLNAGGRVEELVERKISEGGIPPH